MAPRALILGCQGAALTDWERAFFRDCDPLGFILFARNCETPDQVRALTAAMCETVGRADAPILIDQEGGRVARLRPPHWRLPPAAALFGDLAERDRGAALEAVALNTALIAGDLTDLGITVDCLPLLDLPLPEADVVIGDRAFSSDIALSVALAEAQCAAFLAAGVMPVVKHIPGHGRALVDSHHELPRVAASLATLRATDFAPFRDLAEAPWAMTAHIVYEAIDPARPATTSPKVISEVIRGEIGFDGLLLSDDLSMAALAGDIGTRGAACLAAGCDVALHCNGKPAEMTAAAGACGALASAAQARVARAEARRAKKPPVRDRETTAARLAELLALV